MCLINIFLKIIFQIYHLIPFYFINTYLKNANSYIFLKYIQKHFIQTHREILHFVKIEIVGYSPVKQTFSQESMHCRLLLEVLICSTEVGLYAKFFALFFEDRIGIYASEVKILSV